jgi:hypothetical protein
MVNSSELDIENLKLERRLKYAEFIRDENGKYIVGREMKKCQIQIQCSYSDDICNEYEIPCVCMKCFRTLNKRNLGTQQVFLEFWFLKKVVSFVF